MNPFKKITLKEIHCICCRQRINPFSLPESFIENSTDIVCTDCQKKIRNSHYTAMMNAQSSEEMLAEKELAMKEITSYWFDFKGDKLAEDFYTSEMNRRLSELEPLADSSISNIHGNVLISACLLGLRCRYDRQSKPNDKILEILNRSDVNLIPVCPEQLGGLPTPRKPAERCDDKVLCKDNTDVTAQYEKGALEVLSLCRLYHCDFAILKEKSPSCGTHFVYDGSHSGTLIEGIGVTAEKLKENRVTLYSENTFIV